MIAFALALTLQDSPTAVSEPTPINPARWITPDDYPATALRRGEHGLVLFTLDVSEKGRVTQCTVMQSSGSAILDEETCAIMRHNGRFKPARDATGQPVASTWSNKFNWIIPGRR